jgi:predicted kinase
MRPLRCHLLIGPPASGKTTLGRALVPLLSTPEAEPARLLSTDRIRADLFGDAAVQGPWREIEARLHHHLREAVAAGVPVIIDATHARRPWRLAITQGLALPAPVEWIGWWLFTPLATCLAWNRTRPRRVPEPVIRELAAALADPHFGPSRAEGFAAVVAVEPTHHQALTPLLRDELGRLDRRIRAAVNRERHWQRHGYSRLLDLERLLYLLRLLSRWPELEASDPHSRADLEAVLSPQPTGDLAERAAAFLGRLHGSCYADSEALRGDLSWLEEQGFTADAPGRGRREAPVVPPPEPPALADGRGGGGSVHGGFPPTGDQAVFVRLATLLRHILQTPFDRQPGVPLGDHLIARMEATPGAYLPGESASLRKDLERLLTPYGFRARHDNVRHGYALGTALLSAPRLRELRGVVREAAERLGDPTAHGLLAELDQRLGWAGLGGEDELPVRAFANRSVLHPALLRPDSLAVERQAERLETAIGENRRVLLERYASAAAHDGDHDGMLRVWPLQLLFHTISWYLLFEEDAIGREEGLIRCERLDRLALRRSESGTRRDPQGRSRALERARRLLHHCGGIHFGNDLEAQLDLASDSPRRRQRILTTLRFSCQAWAFAFIREAPQRFPIEHTRYSRPRPSDNWWHHPRAPHVLAPNPEGDSHPYPVEIDLPLWTVQEDVDLRTALFGFGAGLRFESPESLRQEHRRHCREALAVYPEVEGDLSCGS